MESPNTNQSRYRYGFALLANARDFVESAVEYARQDKERQWKFSVLHMATALELLLKAKLAMTDYRHLSVGSGLVSERQFEEGEFRSVGIEQCLDRLNRYCDFSLSSDQSQAIKALQRLRNRITHYIEPPHQSSALKATTAAGLNLFIEINNSEFLNADPYDAKSMSELTLELYRNEHFVKERLTTLSSQLSSMPRRRTHHTDECSDCLQDATVIIEGDLKCLFCGREITIPLYAELISRDRSVETCPECNRESVALHRTADGQMSHECFCCGYSRGGEMQWSDGKVEIPRLHSDRYDR